MLEDNTCYFTKYFLLFRPGRLDTGQFQDATERLRFHRKEQEKRDVDRRAVRRLPGLLQAHGLQKSNLLSRHGSYACCWKFKLELFVFLVTVVDCFQQFSASKKNVFVKLLKSFECIVTKLENFTWNFFSFILKYVSWLVKTYFVW